MHEHMFKSNGYWTQEFPMDLQAPTPSKIGYKVGANDFGLVLQDYLKRLGLDEAVWIPLRKYDFSGAAVALVTSVAGVFRKEEMNRYGVKRIAQILSEEGELERGQNNIVFQCSSIGSMSQNYINHFTNILSGNDDTTLELVWPSTEFVRTVRGMGYAAGGSICFNRKNYSPHVKKVMKSKYIGVPERDAVAPHIKTLFRLENDGAASRNLSWMYMGSHNFSKSAWGEPQNQGGQFRVASFELGVLFLPKLLSRVAGNPVTLKLGNSNRLDTKAFGEIVMPIPYQYPCPQYDQTKTDLENTPWMWDVPQTYPDVGGEFWPGIWAK
jgi:tyrosyl-DNA phosphodiesterase-1